MIKKNNFKSITAHCSVNNSDLDLSFDLSPIIKEFKNYLSKLLFNVGIELQWVEDPANSMLQINFTKIQQGNQLLRFFFALLFLSPAIVWAEVKLTLGDSKTNNYFFNTRADIELFGGTGYRMVRKCIGRIARKIVVDVFKFELGRIGWIITLGVISIFFNGIPSIPAVFIGFSDLIKIKKGKISKSSYYYTLIGTIINILIILFGIFVVIKLMNL